MPSSWAALAALLFALAPVAGPAAGVSWDQWKSVPGVFDVGGPMSHGAVVVAGQQGLYLLSPSGDFVPFARGSTGYHDDLGTEAYLAVSPGQRDAAASCGFARDSIFILRLHAPVGVTEVDEFGDWSLPFASIPGTANPNGIAFDTAGAFDHRLIVTSAVSNKTAIFAIDCNGAVQVVTRSAPGFEGGLTVAPMTFGAYGGSLIGPDELSGVIWSISTDGTARKVVGSGLPFGSDIGVEAVAFVPPGFAAGGELYFSDRGTAGSLHPGTDHLLRLSSAQLLTAGVQEGDLLAATEGGATMIDVRCNPGCRVTTVVPTPTTAHGEGHLAFAMGQAASPAPSASPPLSPSPAASPANQPGGLSVSLIAAVLIVGVVGGLIAFAVSRRRA